MDLLSVKNGKKSLAKYVLDENIVAEARERIQALLQRYVLYPELDMSLLADRRFAGEDA